MLALRSWYTKESPAAAMRPCMLGLRSHFRPVFSYVPGVGRQLLELKCIRLCVVLGDARAPAPLSSPYAQHMHAMLRSTAADAQAGLRAARFTAYGCPHLGA